MQQWITVPRDRLEIVELAGAAAGYHFAQDVREGLTAPAKHLSSKYFYDDLGSALFDAITYLPEYYLTRAENEILREWGWEIVRVLDEPVEFLELGSGSAQKTRRLIEEALRVQPTLHYSPIDISPETLRVSSATLVEHFPGLYVRAYAGDYFRVLSSGVLAFEQRVLAMLMGSNLGNYEPRVARDLIALISRVLRPGDALLLGVDRKKDRATLERAYNDPTGVTAAFDRNLLSRINRELGANFELPTFDHVVHYDEKRGVVNSYLQSSREQRVRIEALDLDLDFTAGERIHTESSYKYDDADVAELAAANAFELRKTWTDAESRFALHLLVRTGEPLE
ncbi:MAG TPA: L-histidine N(alpha)-methyltransferase [Candidatus Acidoferrum sp.]|jgi:L-histidine N-alpha-methyltransferase|nr:L-histidine N(alpha)-methyltransferase [Candidatus Acidoferrum sp.]